MGDRCQWRKRCALCGFMGHWAPQCTAPHCNCAEWACLVPEQHPYYGGYCPKRAFDYGIFWAGITDYCDSDEPYDFADPTCD